MFHTSFTYIGRLPCRFTPHNDEEDYTRLYRHIS